MTSNTSNSAFIHDRELLNKASSLEEEMPELIDVLQKTIKHVCALMGVTECVLSLVEANGNSLLSLSTSGGQDGEIVHFPLRLNGDIEGWVIAHREPLLLTDVVHDPQWAHLFTEEMDVTSLLSVPLLHNGICLGAITVRSRVPAAFDATSVCHLSVFAEQTVLTINSLQQAQMFRQLVNQLEMAIQFSRRLTTSFAPDTLHRSILLNVQRLIPYTRGFIHLYQESAHALTIVAELSESQSSTQDRDETAHLRALNMEKLDKLHIANPTPQPENINLFDATSITARAALHRRPERWSPQPGKQPSDGEHRSASAAKLAAPFISKGKLYGVLTIERAEPFNSEELRIVRNLSTMVAASLENIELFHQVYTDQQQLRAILTASSDGLALVGPSRHFTMVNPSFGRVFGLESTQVTGMECSRLFGCQRAEGPKQCARQCLILQALQQERPLPYTEIEFTIHGASRLIGLSVTPVKTANGTICLLLVRDVTETRDAVQVRAKFLSMIAHELRSPLNAINGYLELALAGVGGDLNEQQQEFVRRARTASEHLYALLEDLLLISRADSGQMRLNRNIINLSDVIASAVEEMELSAFDHGAIIVTDIPQPLPPMYADAVRLQQVLRNLISNSLRFTPPGGQITVHAFVEESAHPEPALPVEEDEHVTRVVKLQVSDTGVGISSEYHKRIFERFFQVPENGALRAGGQGLGLAIVKMIVELHGGWVEVDSNPGQGSTFSCILPCLLS